MKPYVTTEMAANGVATITFVNPPHNAMPRDLLGELAAAIQLAGQHPDCRVIVLKSGGDRTFCAGASFDELKQITNASEGRLFFSGFADVINACRTAPQLVVGRVQGKAVGGGVGLAAATDYCFATAFAAVRLSELSIGIGPFVIEPAVSRKVGLAAFTEMTLHPLEFYDADYCQRAGLYHRVFATTEAMDAAILEFVDQLAACNPAAMSALKMTLWRGTEDWNNLLNERAAISGQLVLSDFAQQSLQK